MSKQASKAMAAAASTAGTIAAVAAKPRALGFDCFAYPGDSAMKLWKLNSDYKFIGFYLRAPAHSNNTFLGTRQKLADMGWGTAIIYVGRQAEGPGSGGPLNGPLGTSDATDAIAKTAAEGFGRLSVIFLDVEHMDTIPQGMKDYINAWFLEVVKSRFVPGMYCAASNAAVLKVAALKSYPTGTKPPQFWVAGGRGFEPHFERCPRKGRARAG